jgi:hypothetical protein
MMINKMNGKSYHVIDVVEEVKGSFNVSLDLDGTLSTSTAFINNQNKKLQEISDKYWDADDLLNEVIAFEAKRLGMI